MHFSTLAPTAVLFALFSLSAQAADLGALTGGLTSKLSGVAGDCDKQVQELQGKIDAAKANGEDLKVKALKAAQDQAEKGCKKVGEKAAESTQGAEAAEGKQAKLEEKGMKALGGLLN